MVATKVEDNVLNAHTVIGLDTPVIDVISYIASLYCSFDHSTSSSSVLGSSSTPQGIILTPGEYEEYLRLTQASKSSFIADSWCGRVCRNQQYLQT